MNKYKLSSRCYFKKILIVGNVMYTKRSLATDFRDEGCFVLTAVTENEAMEKILKYKPDIITISHDLPDNTIKELTYKILGNTFLMKTKIILVISEDDLNKKTKEYAHLFNEIISLPLKKNELSTII